MIYCLEMRSTADWQDVRYREYTSSERKAALFKQAVPKIRFTDSAHHIVPVVSEHCGKRKPRNTMLQDHVVDALKATTKPGTRGAAMVDITGNQDERKYALEVAAWIDRELQTAKRTGRLETRSLVQNVDLIIAALHEYAVNPSVGGKNG